MLMKLRRIGCCLIRRMKPPLEEAFAKENGYFEIAGTIFRVEKAVVSGVSIKGMM